jgi:hypothetical protein
MLIDKDLEDPETWTGGAVVNRYPRGKETAYNPITIDAEVLVEAIRNLAQFPYPQICRHSVMLDLLQILTDAKWVVSKGTNEALGAAICSSSAGDARVLEILAHRSEKTLT